MESWLSKNDFWDVISPYWFNKIEQDEAKSSVHSMINLLSLSKGMKLLDLCCGQGTYSLEIAKQGFHVTGVDFTKSYIEKAKKMSLESSVSIEYIQDDMRTFCRKEYFDRIINIGTSFGQFENKKEDYNVLRNIYLSLVSNGIVLMEMMGKEIMENNFKPISQYDYPEIGCTMVMERKWAEDKNMLNRYCILKENNRVKYSFDISHRIYSFIELSRILKEIGFSKVDVFGDYNGNDYNERSKTMVICAKK